MTYFDHFERAQFDTITFPWEELSITGTFRHHVHEYRHTPAGSIEKQGRKLYEFRFSAVFDETFERLYPSLMLSLDNLQELFEQGTTSDLVVPNRGKVSAFITNFERRAAATTRSGERVNLVFLEDRDADLLKSGAPNPLLLPSAATLQKKFATLTDQTAASGFHPDIFDAIAAVVNQIVILRDQVELAELIVSEKALQLVAICQDLDSSLTFFQDPLNHELLEAFKEVWAEALRLAQPSSGQLQVNTYVVRRTSTVQQVSIDIYGRADRSFDLLQFNDFEDVLAIPQGTTVSYPVAA